MPGQSDWNYGVAVAVDGAGNVYMAGAINGRTDFGGGDL